MEIPVLWELAPTGVNGRLEGTGTTYRFCSRTCRRWFAAARRVELPVAEGTESEIGFAGEVCAGCGMPLDPTRAARAGAVLIGPDDTLRYGVPGLLGQIAAACDEKARHYGTSVSTFSAWARAIRGCLPLMRAIVDSDLEAARQYWEE